MTKRILFFLPFLLSAVLLSGCGNFNKLLKSDDVDKKYAAALKYYEEEEYTKAGALLEDLMPLLKGRSEYERANFLYANTKYQQGFYLESSFHFVSFGQTFPRSQYAEEAAYLNARSLVNESPSHNLDQQSTVQAMSALQEFMRRYPQSKFMPEANTVFDELSKKIEVKAFENAKLYYDLRYYQSAVMALANFRKDFPSSSFNELASFLRIEAQYNYAKESITARQRERYLEVVDIYQAFIDAYPTSKYLRQAEGFYTFSLQEIKKLQKENTAATTATNN